MSGRPLDTAYLYQHGRQWIVRVKVPDRLKPILKVSKLVVPLHTDSLALANRDKHKHVHLLKQRLADAELELRRVDRANGKLPAMDPLVAEGLDWMTSLAESSGEPYDPVQDALSARLDEIERKEGETRAGLLATIAHGRGTPLGPMADQWLEVKPLKPRQQLDYRRGVTKLEKWMMAKGLTPTIEATTRRVASDYRDSFIKAGAHPRTANKDISILSGLWKHAERKGVVTENPWRGQTISETSRATGAPGSARKRPPTDGELAAILQAAPEGTLLGDAIRLLAWGGMRCEELARMRVGDLHLNDPTAWVDLKGSKTEAARRSLPIHSAALSIYQRRAEGKGMDAYLLDELRTPPEGSAMERGQPITKHFGRLLARLGIGEKEDGARQGNVDLHSLRRRWVTQAEQAGHPENLIASCVGHQRPGMTFGSYSAGPLLGQLRVVVESVTLPQAGAPQ
jgi:integrase